MNEVDLIIKVTRRCNLRCSYCMDWRASEDTDMSFAVLARTIQAALSEHDRVRFIWHGGETTLRPIAFFKKIMLLQDRFRRSRQQVANILQTNGTQLTDDWGVFFRESRFHIGLSLDGPAHDATRPNVGGKGSFLRSIQGLQILRKHDVPHGVLIVVGNELLSMGPERLFDFILEYDIKSFDCLSSMPPWTSHHNAGDPIEHYTTRSSMEAFMIGLYDRWLAHGDPSIRIRTLDSIRSALRQEGATYCTIAGSCFGRYLLVESNGDICHCDTFQGNPAHLFGNIMHASFSELRQSPNMQRAVDENSRVVRTMRQSCPESYLCNGGCPADRGAAKLYDSTYSEECCGKRGLIEHVRTRMASERASVPNHPPT